MTRQCTERNRSVACRSEVDPTSATNLVSDNIDLFAKMLRFAKTVCLSV